MAYWPTSETSVSRVWSGVNDGLASSQPGIPASPRQYAHGHSHRSVCASYSVWWPSAQSTLTVPALRSAWMLVGVAASDTDRIYRGPVSRRRRSAADEPRPPDRRLPEPFV